MTDRALLTQEYSHEAFRYTDGELLWRERPRHHFASEWHQKVFNARQAGTVAGTVWRGYRTVNLTGRRMGAHRIVFLMHHGFIPPEVDHIDGNPLNNRIENLRAADHAQNLKNLKTPASNTSGVKGVSWHKATGKWAAGIRQEGKWKHLGLFSCIEAAAETRRQAEAAIYGEFANGR